MEVIPQAWQMYMYAMIEVILSALDVQTCEEFFYVNSFELFMIKAETTEVKNSQS